MSQINEEKFAQNNAEIEKLNQQIFTLMAKQYELYDEQREALTELYGLDLYSDQVSIASLYAPDCAYVPTIEVKDNDCILNWKVDGDISYYSLIVHSDGSTTRLRKFYGMPVQQENCTVEFPYEVFDAVNLSVNIAIRDIIYKKQKG